MQLNELTERIIGCAIDVHKKLGAGFLESVYQAALEYEMKKIGLKFEREKGLPVKYDEIYLELGFRCDFYVEDSVIVECKSVKELTSLDEAQLLNYLKITGLPIGLLINFNKEILLKGIKRIVNNLEE
ncbi:MAG: GxxExxY protein [bacterium]|nr:GxxExxY protein [bacterium]